MEGSPTISGGGASGANVHSTNAFSGYYANPFYQGRPGSTGTDAPGGFGAALSGGGGTGGRTSSITSRATGNSASNAGRTGIGTGTSTGSRTGTSITGTQAGQGFGSGFGSTGTTMGRTGTSGTGRTGTTGFGNMGSRNTGFGNMGSNALPQGVLATQMRPVASAVRVRFQTPALSQAAMTSDISTAIGRSSFLTAPANIQVHHDGQHVVLRGQVKDEEEARTAEGIARLTPGVRTVKNELIFPKQ